MKPNKLVPIGIITLALALTAISGTGCTSNNTIQKLRQENTNLTNSLNQLKAQLKTENETMASLQSQIQKLQQMIASLDNSGTSSQTSQNTK